MGKQQKWNQSEYASPDTSADPKTSDGVSELSHPGVKILQKTGEMQAQLSPDRSARGISTFTAPSIGSHLRPCLMNPYGLKSCDSLQNSAFALEHLNFMER